jgi:hypothetical protein
MTIDDGHQQALKCFSVGRDIVIKRYYDDLKDLLLAIIASSGNLFVFLQKKIFMGTTGKMSTNKVNIFSKCVFLRS